MAYNIKLESKPYFVQIFRKGSYNGHDFTIIDKNGEIFVDLHGYIQGDTKYCEISERIKQFYKEVVKGEQCQ